MPYMVVDYLSIVHCTKHITDGFDGIVYLISLVFSQVLYIQLCNRAIQYHLCSTYRELRDGGCPVVVASGRTRAAQARKDNSVAMETCAIMTRCSSLCGMTCSPNPTLVQGVFMNWANVCIMN